MCGVVAGLGRVSQVVRLGLTGLSEGCHVDPTDQAARREITTNMI